MLEFETIARDARLMSKILTSYISPAGKGPQMHYALHHSQYKTDPYNFFVVNPTLFGGKPGDVMAVVNPKIVDRDRSSKLRCREACMSFPFRPGKDVMRYSTITVSYQVPAEDGKSMKHKEEVVTGLMAQIFQHELEHARGSHIFATK